MIDPGLDSWKIEVQIGELDVTTPLLMRLGWTIAKKKGRAIITIRSEKVDERERRVATLNVNYPPVGLHLSLWY